MDWFIEGPISEATAAIILLVIISIVFALVFFLLFPK